MLRQGAISSVGIHSNAAGKPIRFTAKAPHINEFYARNFWARFFLPISSKIFASSSLAGSAGLVHVFFRLRGKVKFPLL